MIVTDLVIVGVGMVSPLGCTAKEHDYLLKAEGEPSARGAFVDRATDPLPIVYCPWIPADAPWIARAATLAAMATRGSLRGLWRDEGAPPLSLAIALPKHTTESDRAVMERAIASAIGARPRISFATGAAGVFAALEASAPTLEASGVLLIAGADSDATPERLADYLARPDSPWDASQPRPAEGAACVALSSAALARSRGWPVLATLRAAGARENPAADDNDISPDGSALTELLHAMPTSATIRAVIGQQNVPGLRVSEYKLAVPRAHHRFHPEFTSVCLEREIGDFGAASGAMSLAFATTISSGPCPVLTWALGRDGVIGVALLEVPAPQQRDGAAQADRIPSVIVEERPATIADEAASPPAPDPARDLPIDWDPPISILADAARGTMRGFYEELWAGLLERLLALSVQRHSRALRDQAELEQRVVHHVHALAAVGIGPGFVLQFWEDSHEELPHAAWVAGLVFGACAGANWDSGLRRWCEMLQGVPFGQRMLAADALALSPKADLPIFLAELRRSEVAPLRAVAIEALSRRGPAAIEPLSDDDLAARAALLRHRLRHPTDERRAAIMINDASWEALLHVDDPDLVGEIARASLILGDQRALEDIRSRGRLAKQLGPRAVELLALVGEMDDVRLIDTLLGAHPSTVALLRAVARYGHRSLWGYLTQALDDEDLSEAAGEGLATLFGPLVDETAQLRRERWEAALASATFPPDVRLRRGAPWAFGVWRDDLNVGLAVEDLVSSADEARLYGRRDVPDPVCWGEAARAEFMGAMARGRR